MKKPTNAKIFYLALIFALVGIIGNICTLNYLGSGVWHNLVATLSSILVGAGLIQILFEFFALENFLESISAEINRKINLPVDKFYEDRSQLPTWEKELEGADEVWYAWHTGSARGALGVGEIKREGETRLLLTHPKSEMLNEIGKIAVRSKEALRKDVYELTEEAQKKGIEVKWLDGPIGNSVIIVNPSSEEAHARVEVLLPSVDTNKRPSFTVIKKESKTFNNILEAYKDMWDKAEEPSKEAK